MVPAQLRPLQGMLSLPPSFARSLRSLPLNYEFELVMKGRKKDKERSRARWSFRIARSHAGLPVFSSRMQCCPRRLKTSSSCSLAAVRTSRFSRLPSFTAFCSPPPSRFSQADLFPRLLSPVLLLLPLIRSRHRAVRAHHGHPLLLPSSLRPAPRSSPRESAARWPRTRYQAWLAAASGTFLQ